LDYNYHAERSSVSGVGETLSPTGMRIYLGKIDPLDENLGTKQP